MMSLQQINDANRDAAVHASVDNQEPFICTAQDIATWKNGRGLPIPFPYLGDYDPPGYEMDGEPLFVDTSGFGEVGEAALTAGQMLDALRPNVGYAFTSIGQFQAYLQPYRVLKLRGQV